MIRKTALSIAAAAAITAAAMGATASTASAGVSVYLGGGFYGPGVDVGYGWGHGGYYNPCRRWLKKYHWTGKHRYLRKYRRCMRWH